MHGYLTPGHSAWLELALVLAVGTTVIVGLAALADRWIRSAMWRRTLWQVATLGLLALVLVELTGAGPALVCLCRTRTEAPTCESKAEDVPGLVITPPKERAAARSGLKTTVGRTVTDAISRVVGSEGSRTPNKQALGHRYALPQPPDALPQPPDAVPAAESGHAWWPGLVWALGAILVTGRIVCTRVLLLMFRRRHDVVKDETLCRCVGKLAERLGIRRPVTLVQGAGLAAPAAFGSLRPTIALPAGFAQQYDRRQQEAMLAHELAHLAAGDPAWQLLADLLCAALWWHPLAWWSRRRLRAASEATADEASLLVPDGPDALADCLVAIGRRMTGRRQLGWLSMAGSGFRSGLGRRVERLLRLPKRSWRAPGRRRLAFARTALPAILVILAVLCTAWVRPRATSAEGGTTMNVLTTSWRRSLAATALLALMSPVSGDAAVDQPTPGQPDPAVASDDPADFDAQLAMLDDEDEPEHRAAEARERHRAKAHLQEIHERHRDLEERAEDIKHEMERFRDHRGEEFRDLQRELHAIKDKARHLEREAHEIQQALRGPRDLPPREPTTYEHHLQQRAKDIKHEMQRLGDDRSEEFRELQEELHAIENESRRLKPAEQHRPDPREELERRINHMRAAIENLHAAGMHDVAEDLTRAVEDLIREHREHGRHHPEGPPPPEQIIDELRGEIHQLRRDVDEMRGLLRELLEHERDDDDREMDDDDDREHDDDEDDEPDDDEDEPDDDEDDDR